MPGREPRGGRKAQGGLARHVPVLLSEMLAALAPRDGETYIDGTFGAGGHTRAILEAANCRVVAVVRDADALEAGRSLAREFGSRLILAPGRFGDLDEIARASDAPVVNGVLLDVGVSSMQLDEAGRGFSFQVDGPLDMRMSREGPTAAEIVNTTDERALAGIFYEYGEERRSRAIARAIAEARRERPFTRTSELAGLVSRVLGRRWNERQHPATRTFQALRIFVNDELGELARGLAAAERCLAPGGRLVVITFHSLEDRIAKRFLAARSGRTPRGSRHLPEISRSAPLESFQIVNLRPLTPSKGEIEANPRARSARLRAALRSGNPPWPQDLEELGFSGPPD